MEILKKVIVGINGTNLTINIPRVVEKELNIVKGQIIELGVNDGNILLNLTDRKRTIQEVQIQK